MKFRYKKTHYKEQLKRPQKKRCKNSGSLMRECNYLDTLYNSQFRINERLQREKQREKQILNQQKTALKLNLKRFRAQFPQLNNSLNKIFKVMKNQTILGFFKPTINNVIDNVISSLNITNNKVINRLNSLNWLAVDFSTQETQKDTFKNLLLSDAVLARYLNIAETLKAKKEKQAKKTQEKELAKALTATGLTIEQLIAIAQAQANNA